MQWFSSYRSVAIFAALTSGLILLSFGVTSHVTQDRRDSTPKVPIAAFVNTTTVEDITEADKCEMIDSAWNQGTFYFAHYADSSGFEAPDDLQSAEIVELPFKPLFCPKPAQVVASLTL